jgi:cytochrome c oxidase assembly factor 3
MGLFSPAASAGNVAQTLKRARAGYSARNIVTGTTLVGFAAGVFSYSIHSVKQEDFSDVPAPAPLSPPASSPGATQSK